MTISEFEKKPKTDWTLTDRDTCQFRRTDLAGESNIFELVQINRYPGHFSEDPYQDQEYFKISHGRIDLSDHTPEEIEEMWSITLGYGSEEEIDPGYLAEGFFEMESIEYEETEEYHTWNEAVDAAAMIIGAPNLNHLKETNSLDERIHGAQDRANAQNIDPAIVPEKGRA